MQTKQIKFVLFVIGLALFELIINSLTMFYIDVLGILIVILLVNDHYQIRTLIILSILADLIGHWYLGTHLLAAVLISMVTNQFIHFYKVCSVLQKNFFGGIIFTIFVAIISIIGLITHNFSFSWISYLIEVLLLIPIVVWLFQRIVVNFSTDIIL